MPRISTSRVLKMLLKLWLTMALLWAFLPNFSISPKDRDSYITRELSAGRRILGTIVQERIFQEKGSIWFTYSGIAMHWQFHTPRDEGIALQIGTTKIPVGQISDDAHDFFDKWRQQHSNSSSAGEGASAPSPPPPPYLGPAFQTAFVYSDAHPLAMPWFNRADTTLLCRYFWKPSSRGNEFMEKDSTPFDLCIVMPRPHVVEVWAAKTIHASLTSDMRDQGIPTSYNARDSGDANVFNKDLAILSGSADADHEAGAKRDEIFRKVYQSQRYSHPWAQFNSTTVFRNRGIALKSSDRTIHSRIHDGELPSRTFPIRRLLAAPLGWSFAALHYFFVSIPMRINAFCHRHAYVLIPACIITLLSCALACVAVFRRWVQHGCPEFVRWSQNSNHLLLRLGWGCCYACLGARRVQRMANPRVDLEEGFDDLLGHMKTQRSAAGSTVAKPFVGVQGSRLNVNSEKPGYIKF